MRARSPISATRGAWRDPATLLEAWKAAARDKAGRVSDAGLAALIAALEAEGARLRTAAARPAASILISVDQAEEMARAEGDSGEALADYLRARDDGAAQWQLVFTIRTDSFPELQRHRRFQDLEARGYDLRAIPVFRFDSVVEEPAQRYGVDVDPALVDALMEDAPKEDALPLLAFALQRLWRQYAASGRCGPSTTKVGGLKGLIEDAAERALRGIEPEQCDRPLPRRPRKRAADLGARTFVPALAQINDQGATIRRVAAWPSSARSSTRCSTASTAGGWSCARARGGDGGTVEVAHEALFREWGRLRMAGAGAGPAGGAAGRLGAAAAWKRKGRRAQGFPDAFRGARLRDALGVGEAAAVCAPA